MNIFLLLLLVGSSLASVVGTSTHPMKENAKVLSAEMTGDMSQRHEMEAGIRYAPVRLLDVTASGGHRSAFRRYESAACFLQTLFSTAKI